MKTSEQINEIAEALSKAQGEIKNPPKNKKVKVRLKNGGGYEYAYSEFSVIMDEIRIPLKNHGLAISQSINWEGPYMDTYLFHSSGQYISCSIKIEVTLDPDKNKMQQWASAISFARRYGVNCIMCLASEDDTDGRESGTSENEGKISDVQYEEKSISAAQLDLLQALIEKNGDPQIIERMKKHYKVEDLSAMSSSQASDAIKYLQGKRS